MGYRPFANGRSVMLLWGQEIEYTYVDISWWSYRIYETTYLNLRTYVYDLFNGLPLMHMTYWYAEGKGTN